MPKEKRTRPEEKRSDLEGIIIPVRWDENGHPTAVALATSQEEEFFIDMKNKMGKKLLDFLQKKVRVNGAVTTFNNDQKMITIKEYLPIAYDEFVLHRSTGKIPI